MQLEIDMSLINETSSIELDRMSVKWCALKDWVAKWCFELFEGW